MKHLNKENINKNQVETVEQFKVLLYLENTFNLDEIELYLYDKSTIKLIDKNKVQAYFKYNKQSKKIHSKNELERWGLEKKFVLASTEFGYTPNSNMGTSSPIPKIKMKGTKRLWIMKK